MMYRKTAISLTLIGLFAANIAFALPEFPPEVPQSSVDACIAQVGSNADYDGAVAIKHAVETSERRVSGHKMRIRTSIFSEDGETVIREYFTSCAVNGDAEVQRFKIRQKGRM